MIKGMAGGLVRLSTPMKPPAFPEGQPLLIDTKWNMEPGGITWVDEDTMLPAEDQPKPTIWQRIKGWFV